MLLLLVRGVGMGGSAPDTPTSSHRRRIQPLIRTRKRKKCSKK
jgi:hypothetical protein